MTLEIKDAGMEGLFRGLSVLVEGGSVVTLDGAENGGCTALLMAVMGVEPLSEGFITFDGEPMTVLSAPFLRRFMCYVPRHLVMPDDDLDGLSEEEVHCRLLNEAARSGRPVVLVDGLFSEQEADICRQMAAQGCAVLIVRS